MSKLSYWVYYLLLLRFTILLHFASIHTYLSNANGFYDNIDYIGSYFYPDLIDAIIVLYFFWESILE